MRRIVPFAQGASHVPDTIQSRQYAATLRKTSIIATIPCDKASRHSAAAAHCSIGNSVAPEGSKSHPGNILTIQVCRLGVIAGSPYLLVFQYWHRIVANDSLRMASPIQNGSYCTS